jgi:hypothetical protein
MGGRQGEEKSTGKGRKERGRKWEEEKRKESGLEREGKGKGRKRKGNCSKEREEKWAEKGRWREELGRENRKWREKEGKGHIFSNRRSNCRNSSFLISNKEHASVESRNNFEKVRKKRPDLRLKPGIREVLPWLVAPWDPEPRQSLFSEAWITVYGQEPSSVFLFFSVVEKPLMIPTVLLIAERKLQTIYSMFLFYKRGHA